jgi:hypothetical protein
VGNEGLSNDCNELRSATRSTGAANECLNGAAPLLTRTFVVSLLHDERQRRLPGATASPINDPGIFYLKLTNLSASESQIRFEKIVLVDSGILLACYLYLYQVQVLVLVSVQVK